MRVLLAVLLVGIVGCGGEDSPDDGAAPSSPTISPVKAENAEADAPKTKPVNSEDVSQAEPKDLAQERTETPTDVPSDSSSDDAVAALKKLGARIKQDDQGEVVEGLLNGRKITDAGLVHLKGMTKLESLDFRYTQITDAGLVHLKGLTSLVRLELVVHAANLGTKVTDAGVADLQKALPNCLIIK